MNVYSFLLLLVLCLSSVPPAEAALGLTRGPGLTLLLDGKPWRGMGFNYWDCFQRVLKDPKNNTYEHGFEVLHNQGIPVVRFMAGSMFPKYQRLYLDNKEEYFRRLDAVVAAAAKNHVGLIPSLNWWRYTIPDLVGEHADQWGNPNSKSVALLRAYTTDVVSRYRNNPVIWGWEFGNEWDSYSDLPNAAHVMTTLKQPKVFPSLGTPATRTPEDYPRFAQAVVAYAEFAKIVRKLDSDRIIESGQSILRENLWHFIHEKSFANDTPEQLVEMIRFTTPDPMDVVSAHCYKDPIGNGRRRTEMERLDGFVAAAATVGKPVMVGEFQHPNDYVPDSPEAKQVMADFLDRLARLKVPLALVWNYDLPSQENTHNVTETNRRAWVFPMVREYNARVAKEDSRQK